MRIPAEVPVMTLRDATLFPQALLPLFIFEPRYRQMLADALESHRMFIVARQKPDESAEIPERVAGLGMIRVCVGHADGTSHLVLQGLTRVRIEQSLRQAPYPVARVRPVRSVGHDSVAEDALVAKVRELVHELMRPGLDATETNDLLRVSERDVVRYLDAVTEPEQVADLVSCALLRDGAERQTLLETEDVEARLRRLIQFLLAEVRRRRKSGGHE